MQGVPDPKTLLLLDCQGDFEKITHFLESLRQGSEPVHILIMQDAPNDTLQPTTRETLKRLNSVTAILSNFLVMGYGGNQKLGYRYAIQNNYTWVIHVPRGRIMTADIFSAIVVYCRENSPDLLLVDDPLLTAFERGFCRLCRLIIGSNLFVLPFGIRVYSRKFLSQVAFELNSDSLNFDTEILLQALALEASVKRLSAARYVDASYHLGFHLGLKTIRSCLKYRFQRVGFFCSMQYRGLLRQNDRYADKSDTLGSTHQCALSHVRVPTKVLDLGCGPGYVSGRLKELGCRVVGVDKVRSESYPGDQFVQADLENGALPVDVSGFDYVLLLDLLEHLDDPERLLVNCRYSLKSQHRPRFIFSTGNVAFLGIRILLGLGFFNYGERGILDVTHKRLFTLATFKRMLRETGYQIQNVDGVGIPFRLLFTNRLGTFLSSLSNFLARIWPSLLAYQFVIEAEPKLHSYMLLDGLED